MPLPIQQHDAHIPGNRLRINQLLGYECCYCGVVENKEKIDLHEVIFSRGDVMGAGPEALRAIMHRCNCAYVHQRCHKFVEGGPGRIRAIRHIMVYEGFLDMQVFVGSLIPFIKGNSVAHAVLDLRRAWETLAKLSREFKDGNR